ncbi:ABC transporter substrate-binding protein [Rhodovarius crocodyli]|nr:ABC transporter substrate-binding protein [Rhodovarius crocodyli]
MHRRHVFGLAAGLSGCALAGPALAQDRRATTLRFVPNGSGLATPDPVWTTGAVVGVHAQLIYDVLYGYDQRGLPQPQMVAGHQVSDDGRRWVLTLREGLFFHDGEPVRAADAVQSLARWSRRDTFGQVLYAQVEEVRALDDRRLEFRLKKPFPLLPAALAQNAFIMPERVARTDPFQQITDYTGSGPWRFLRDEWVVGAGSAYARFDRYVPRQEPSDGHAGGKVAHFERVEWRVLPDASTAIGALQNNEVDWVERPLFDLLPRIRRIRNVKLDVFNTLGRIGLVQLNHLYPPFDNPEIRRAALAAISQDDMMAAIVGDEAALGKTGVGYFTEGSPYASREGLGGLFTGNRDIPALKERVRRAGYRGEKVRLLSPADMDVIKAISDVAAATFQSIGLDVEYISMDFGSVLTRRANRNPPDQGGWNAHTTTWTGLGMLSPATNTPLRANGPQAWSGWPDLPELEKLRQEWFDAPDLATQQAVARGIQRAAVDGVPYLPVGQWQEPTALRADLTGLPKASLAAFWNLRRA